MASVAGLLLVATAATGCVSNGGRLTVVEENDLYNPVNPTDRDYTHGLKLAATLPEKETPEWMRDAAAKLPTVDRDRRMHTGFYVAQEIFTPRDLWRKKLIDDDRPYAGWLYAGLAVQSPALDTDPERRDDFLDHFEIQLGTIGPAAQADNAQEIVHDITSDAEPEGWDHQLENEPGLVLMMERRFRTWYRPSGGDWAMDLIPDWRVRLGNVHTDLRGGVLWRWGKNLRRDFGPMVIDSHGLEEGKGDLERSLVFHAGVHGEAVGRNIFLDGNTWSDSHRVDKHWVVAEGQVGATWHVGDFSLGYSWIIRTPEYREKNRYHVVASVILSYSIWF
jgi:hypothetical protein